MRGKPNKEAQAGAPEASAPVLQFLPVVAQRRQHGFRLFRPKTEPSVFCSWIAHFGSNNVWPPNL